MPTLRLDENEEIIIEDDIFNIKHITQPDWVFEYDRTQTPLVSSQRKRVFSGTYLEPESGLSRGIPACAVEFSPDCLDVFGRECTSLAKANTAGAGPRVFQINTCPPLVPDDDGGDSNPGPRALIIEEDVGVTLAQALEEGAEVPGSAPLPLHPLGSPERDIENAKIEFDVFSQLANLHASGLYHRDLRVANVCVRRYGERPQDIRAALIDFELIADVSKFRLEAAAREYLDTIFKGKTFLLPIEIDMGYLAAFCFELETGRSVLDADSELYSGKRYPFYRLSNGTVYVRRINQEDLDALARKCGLIRVDEEGMAELTGERFRLSDIVECVSSLVKHGGYLDAKDIALLWDDPEFVILSNREKIAVESFETYKRQVRDQGGVPDYEDFYAQTMDLIESGLDNVTKYRAKLESFGYRIVLGRAVRDRDSVIEKFDDEELERLAKLEHDRWMRQKIEQGYVYGEVKDEDKKTHPDLIPYEELPENEKAKDRRNIYNMVPFLREMGLCICR